jgi:pilus assembly protein Flp/PilA
MTYVNDALLRLMAWRDSRVADEEGQGLTEYGLILALVAIAAVAALGALGGKVESTISNVTGSLK